MKHKSKVYQYGLRALNRSVDNDSELPYNDSPWNNRMVGEATPGGGQRGYYTGKKDKQTPLENKHRKESRKDVVGYQTAGSKEKKQRHRYETGRDNY